MSAQNPPPEGESRPPQAQPGPKAEPVSGEVEIPGGEPPRQLVEVLEEAAEQAFIRVTSQHDPLTDRLTPEHIDKVLEIQDKQATLDDGLERFKIWAAGLVLCQVLILG